jgi:hypothetical protein
VPIRSVIRIRSRCTHCPGSATITFSIGRPFIAGKTGRTALAYIESFRHTVSRTFTWNSSAETPTKPNSRDHPQRLPAIILVKTLWERIGMSQPVSNISTKIKLGSYANKLYDIYCLHAFLEPKKGDSLHSCSGIGPIILPNIAIVRCNEPFDSNRIQ